MGNFLEFSKTQKKTYKSKIPFRLLLHDSTSSQIMNVTQITTYHMRYNSRKQSIHFHNLI